MTESDMAGFTVKWAPVAEEDLKEIIAKDSVAEARCILARLREEAATLTSMPGRGRVVPELKEQGIFCYRELQSPPWRMICRVDEKVILVLAVLDSRRNLEDLLLERFSRA